MELIVLDKDAGSLSGKLRDLSGREKRITGSLFFRKTEGLLNYLRTFSEATRLVVILDAGGDLFEVLDLRKSLEGLLEGVQLVLVLADHEPETVAAAHRLKPRYLCFMDGYLAK